MGASISTYKHGQKFAFGEQTLNKMTAGMVGFVCGAAKDWRRPGAMHQLEHALTEMIKGNPESKVFKYARANAIDLNAQTTQDYVAIEFEAPSDCLEELLPLISEMLTSNYIDAQGVEDEKPIILQEKRMTEEMIRHSQIDIIDYMYNKSTMGIDRLIGSQKSIMNTTPEYLLDLKKKYFIAENLIVSMVSNRPKEEIKTLVEKEFINKVPSNPRYKVVPKKRTYDFNYLSNKEIAIDDTDAKTFQIELIYKTKGSYTKNEVFNFFKNWLFNGMYGELDRVLRQESSLTYTSDIYEHKVKDGRFSIIDITTTAENAPDCITRVSELLHDLVTNGISEETYKDFHHFVGMNRARHVQVKVRSAHNLFEACVERKRPFVKNFFQKCLDLTREQLNDWLYEEFGNGKFIVGYKGNIDLANYAALMSQPFSVLTEKGVAMVDKQLLPHSEVAYIISPKVRLRTDMKENLGQLYHPCKHYCLDKPKLRRRSFARAIKQYLNNNDKQNSVTTPQPETTDTPQKTSEDPVM